MNDPKKQLKPLSDEIVRKIRAFERQRDSVFLTQNMDSLDASMMPRGTPDAATLIESPD